MDLSVFIIKIQLIIILTQRHHKNLYTLNEAFHQLKITEVGTYGQGGHNAILFSFIHV